jgi:hypothetical protein
VIGTDISGPPCKSSQILVVTDFASWWSDKLPAQELGGLYKTHHQSRDVLL